MTIHTMGERVWVMGNESGLILETGLESFFREEVTDARRSIGVDISDETEYYVVNLLCTYSNPQSTPLPGDEPLAMLYKRALEASPLDRIQILKNLGDVALYVSGFFVEFIERSLVDRNYYMSMGGSAYHSLSDIMSLKHQCESVAGVYSQLANKFSNVVDLLNEISNRSRRKSSPETELLRTYERWQKSGDEKLKNELAQKGFFVPTQPHEVKH